MLQENTQNCSVTKPPFAFRYTETKAEWRKLPTKFVVVDVETHGLAARITCDTTVYWVVVATQGEGNPRLQSFSKVEEAVDYLQPLLNNGYGMVVHNAKFDVPVLELRGLRVSACQVYDTQVLAYLHQNNLPSYSLAALTGAKEDLLAQVVACGYVEAKCKLSSFWERDWSSHEGVLELMRKYCVADVKATYALYKRLQREIPEKTTVAYHVLEQPMLPILVGLERRGAPIDVGLLQTTIQELRTTVAAYKTTINERYGMLPELQWDKKAAAYVPKAKEYTKKPHPGEAELVGYFKNKSQVPATYYSPLGVSVRDWGGYGKNGEWHAHVSLPKEEFAVYNHCALVPYNAAAATGHTWWLIKRECPEALEVAAKTKGGRPSVNKEFLADVVELLPDELPIAKLAKVSKKLSMAEGIWKHLDADNRIRPEFAHTRTLTGRLATNSPNLQNMPRPEQSDESTVFRRMFAAGKGNCLFVADLDQIELRVLAYMLKNMGGDPTMAASFHTVNEKGECDPHSANAAKWGVSRTVAKTLIFLLIYGGQPALMFKRKLFSTLAEAEAAFAGVHEAQPSIRKLMEKVCTIARRKGYVETIGGRRCYYPKLSSTNKWERLEAERQCFNALIQGSARDIMHKLIIETQPVLEAYPQARIINCVHDELIVEGHTWYADSLRHDLNCVWQCRLDLLPGVPVNGDWNVGRTWYEAK